MKTVLSLAIVFVILTSTCVAGERLKRDEATGNSFGDMFNKFMAAMFGTGNKNDDAAIDAIKNITADNGTNATNDTVIQKIFNDVTDSLTSETVNDATDDTSSPSSPSSSSSGSFTSESSSTLSSTSSTKSTSRSGDSSMMSSDSSASSTTSPNWITTIVEDTRCFSEAVLQNFCSVGADLVDVSFWDLYSVLFSDTVIDALMIGCTRGSWCLQDRFDYWEALVVERVDMVMNSEIAADMCRPEIRPCLDTVIENFRDCDAFLQMEYTVDALQLICDLKQNPSLTSECYKHALAALHVTLADIMRRNESSLQNAKEDICKSPEEHMTRGLICVTNSCPSEIQAFNGFGPWSWFTSVVDDLIDRCDLDPNKCLALLTPQAGRLYEGELGTLVGVSVVTMVTAVVLAIAVCTCYKRHRRNAVIKDGYQQLLNDVDES
ncbi:hypothetical protein MAR_006620 [Mya arenaria]|uniref:Uncharacterized protein n=1 Tax=Mya arenaria TaxID=6604 RepID=A0ABY7DA05_MYAAR|nr:uncharacterized protein LOC128229362 [Mya arenaria]WAQ94149.1 hypothetical protein MAR_006620 [Mya arenaria]